MKNSINSCLHEGVIPRLGFGVIFTACVIGFSSMDTLMRQFIESSILPQGYHIDFMLSALSSDILLPFIPIISVLPFSGNYVDEVKSNFSRYILLRSSFTRYLMSRIVVCVFCGGLVITLGITLAFFLSFVFFKPMEVVALEATTSSIILWKRCILFFLCGGMWSVLGMTFSTFVESKYVSYVSPFVVYYILTIIYERYCPNFHLIYPKGWTNLEWWPYGYVGGGLFLLEMISLFSTLFIARAGQRICKL